MATTYHVVFAVATAGYRRWTFPTFGLLSVAIATLLGWLHPTATNVGASTMPGLLATLDDRRLSRYARRLRSVAMPAEGHANERFCVRTACYAYSDCVVTTGFDNASSHGGPIADGGLAGCASPIAAVKS